MKKLLIILFTICIAISASGCGELPTDGDLPTFTPSDAGSSSALSLPELSSISNATIGDAVVYCTSKELTGDFGRGMWSAFSGDMLVQELIDDASIFTLDRNGEYILNNTVCNSLEIKENSNSTKTYIINIAQDLTYNNGLEITAKDYVLPLLYFSSFSGDQAESKDIGACIIGHDEYRAGQTHFLSGIRLIDRYSYSVTLSESDATYYDMLCVNSYPMNINAWFGEGSEVMDQGDGAFIQGDLGYETIEDALANARTNANNRVSCGPYTLVDYDDAAKKATLELNPYYKGNSEGIKPSIKKIIICNSDDNHIEMLLRGDASVIDALKDPKNISSLMEISSNYNIAYHFFERNGFGKLIFQCDVGAAKYSEARQAFAHLVNRQGLIDEYLKGAGSIVNGPYSTAMWQYKASDIDICQYEYSYDKSVELLEAGGWTLNSSGGSYSQGDGLRYKAVSQTDEDNLWGVERLSNGTVAIPLEFVIALPEGSEASLAIKQIIGDDENIVKAGFSVKFEEMPFSDEMMYLFRNAQEDIKYAATYYNVFSSGMDFKTEYDMSDSFVTDLGMQNLGYNPSRIIDDKLEKYSKSMIKRDNRNDFLEDWCEFVKEYNEVLPELPLYMNSYMSAYNKSIEGYSETAFWGFERAIIYAHTNN